MIPVYRPYTILLGYKNRPHNQDTRRISERHQPPKPVNLASEILLFAHITTASGHWQKLSASQKLYDPQTKSEHFVSLWYIFNFSYEHLVKKIFQYLHLKLSNIILCIVFPELLYIYIHPIKHNAD